MSGRVVSRGAIAWGPAVLWALGLFLLSEVQITQPRLQPLLVIPDKLVHFALYFGLVGILALARWVSGTDVWHVVLLAVGCTYGAVDEWHQSLVFGRTPAVADWLADVAGVFVGYLIVALVKARGSRNTDYLD